jgi:hypothetical protein
MGAQHHVADEYRAGQPGFVVQLFQSNGRIKAVHKIFLAVMLPLFARLPTPDS